jgi:hypothetical protein
MRRLPFALALFMVPSLVSLVTACGGNITANAHEAEGDDGGIPLIVLPDAAPPSSHPRTPSQAEPPDASTDAGDDSSSAPAAPLGLTAVPLSVCVPNEYTAAVTVGTQTFEMALDTGSTTLGVASSDCSSCGVTPAYSPGKSAVDEHQTGMSDYGTGSWSGEIYRDTVSLAKGASAPVDLVAIDAQSQFFQPGMMCDSKISGMQGIIGFGPSASALQGTNAFFDQLIATTQVPDVFATELCATGGTLWLGGYDPAATTAAPQYTPLSTSLLSSYYYAVGLTSITVAGVSVPVASEQYPDSVVDTGTSVFMLPTSAFDAVTAAISASPGFQSVFGATASDGGADAGASPWFASPQDCVPLPGETKATLDAKLPPLTLVFGSNPGIEVQALPTESYMMTYEGYWCPTLYANEPGPEFPVASIIGSPVLRSNVVIFDRASSRVGFAPHKACD